MKDQINTAISEIINEVNEGLAKRKKNESFVFTKKFRAFGATGI